MPLDDARHGSATATAQASAAQAVAATAVAAPPVASIGHNGGPPLDEPPPRGDWNYYCWRRAHKRAWKTPPREIALRRLRHAEALGMTYREYQAVILDSGVYVQERPVPSERAWPRTMRTRMKRGPAR
ncbi:MAG TPA: hypothetical protein VIF14_06750 [Alphaproteobacteria bacterium]